MTDKYFYSCWYRIVNKIFGLFSAFGNNSHEMAKTKLESMQIAAKQKKKAAEQAVLEALEAENYVEAIELEIEVVKRKGCIEETFWRFPHIGEQIFEELDNTTLFKCLEINKWWQKFIIERKIRQINQLENHTYIKASILKKELGNKDFETVQKLADYSMKVYRKVIIDCKNTNGVVYEDYGRRKQQGEILRYLCEKKHRDKIQYLLTELMVKNTKKVDLNEMAALVRNGDFELLRILNEIHKLDVDYFFKFYEEIHLRWRNGNYSGELLKDAILALNPDLHGHI